MNDISGAYCYKTDNSYSCKAVDGGPITSKTFTFKVVKPKQCKLQNFPFSSSVSLSSGNLSHSQELFSANGNAMPVSVSLYYNSLEAHPVNLGPGWNHSYDIELVEPASRVSGTFVLREANGERHLYTGSTYTSQPGDFTVLKPKADNSGYTVTFPGGRYYSFPLINRTTNLSKIAAMTDRDGNTVSFGYNANGNLETASDSAGRVARFSYSGNLLSTITDPAGNQYTIRYTGGKLNFVSFPSVPDSAGVSQTGQWLYTYNDNGLLETKTDPSGNSITYVYDGKRVKDAFDPTGSKKTVNLAPLLNDSGDIYTGPKTATFIDKDRGEWTYAYDRKEGLMTSKTDPNGKTTSYYYKADRTEKARTEPFDNNISLTTFFTYDDFGNVLTQTDPVDISTMNINLDTVKVEDLLTNNTIVPALSYTYDYDNNDQVASITDHRGGVATTTTYQYAVDSVTGDKLTTVIDPDNHVTTTRYYGSGTFKGSIKAVTDANGQTTTYTYYPDIPANRTAAVVGLLYEVAGPDGVKTRYTSYDKNGNALEIKTIAIDNSEIRTVQTFDAMNRLRTVTRYAQGLPNNVTTYAYDKSGNRTYQKDPEGKVTTFQYDYKGHVTKVIDAQTHDTQYLYGGTGGSSCTSCGGGGGDKLTGVIDAKQQTTSFNYDQLGRLILETDPLGKKIRYTYYDSGLVREKIDATAAPGTVLIKYYYDTLGRLTKKHYADNTEETYSYDAKGRMQTAANANIGYTFAYYGNGWLQSVADSSGRVITYDQYDGIGQKKQVTYFPGTTDQRQLTYGYDPANLNRLKTISSGTTVTFTYGYDKFGRRESLAYPNGTKAVYLYDDLNRLTSLTHNVGTTPFLTYGYTFDQAGNRKTRTGTVAETYGYDDVYRLLQASTATGTKKYTYDPVGNRTTGPGPKDTAYQYDAANRMLIGKLFNYGYDNYGNQTTRTIPNAQDKGWTLTWDLENRLKRMYKEKKKDGVVIESSTVTFKYDPMGRRIEKKLVTVVSGTTKTTTWNYVYDGDNIAMETLQVEGASAPVKTFYTHGQGTDEHLALERSDSFYYYHADGLGSITAITDASKAVVQSYTYDSFGMAKAANNTFLNSYTYTSREWDRETGLYYYRARYYDPMEGRFVSKDPIGFDGGINIYSYVQNNSINNVDPNGLAAYQGTLEVKSGGFGGGAAYLSGEIRTACVDGLQEKGYVRAILFGAFAPAGVGWTASRFTLEDDASGRGTVRNLSGGARIISAGGAAGPGGGWTDLLLGKARSKPSLKPGFEAGIEIGAMLMHGASFVTSVETVLCPCSSH